MKEVMDAIGVAIGLLREAAPALAQLGSIANQLMKTGADQMVVQKQMVELQRALVVTQGALQLNTTAVERCEASNRQMAQQIHGLAAVVEEIRVDNRHQDTRLAAIEKTVADAMQRLHLVETTPPHGTRNPVG